MKKLLSLLLIISMLLTIVPMNTAMAARNKNVKYEAALPIFSTLIAAEISELEAEDPERKITRAEFCEYVCRFFDLQTIDAEHNFVDLRSEDYYYTFVATLIETGAIAEARNFRPDDIITVDEATKILFCLGGWQTYADCMGGFPDGYRYMTRELNVIPAGLIGEVDFKTMVSLIVGIGDSYVCSFGILGEKTSYVPDETTTILSKYRGINKARGVPVNGIYGISDSLNLEENEIMIGDKIYILKDSVDVYDYYGKKVDVYYIEEDSEMSEEIVGIYAIEDDDNEELVISATQFNSFADNTIYYYNEHDARKKEKIIPGAIYVYNNEVISENVSELFDDFYKGTITLRDSDGDNEFDLVLIKSYELHLVNFYDENQKTLYNYFGPYAQIDMSQTEIVKIRSNTGVELSGKSLLKDTPILVAKSRNENYIDIVVCVNTQTGKVTRFSGEGEITINGEELLVDERYIQQYGNTIAGGREYSYITDMFGEICFMKLHSEYTVGYLYKHKIDRDSEYEGLMLTVFTETGEHVKYTCAESVTVDGKKWKETEEIMRAFPGAVGNDIEDIEIPNQIIRFSFNGDGLINRIDTLNTKSSKDDDVLKCTHDSNLELHANKSRFRLGMNVILSANTVVMIIPTDENIENAAQNEFSITKGMSPFTHDWSYVVEAYQTDKNSEYVDYLIYKSTNAEPIENSNPFIVNKITITVNEYDEIVQRIEGLGVGTTYRDALENVDLSNIEQGDLIRFSTDPNGLIDTVELLYDASEGGRPTTWPGLNNGRDWYTNTASYRQAGQFTFGYASFKGTNVVGWDFDNDGTTDEMYDIITNNIPIYVYDESEDKDSCVYLGKITDIVDYNSSSSKCSRIIFQTNKTSGAAMFVYK